MNTKCNVVYLCAIIIGMISGYALGDNGAVSSGSPPWPNAMSGENGDMLGWNIYKNQKYGFKIKYFNNYEIFEEEPRSTPGKVLQPLAKISFRQKVHARSAIKGLGPAEFTIQIFENDSNEKLHEWLSAKGFISSKVGSHTEAYSTNGMTGISIISDNFMAPGRFFYFTNGVYIYQLTPLGTVAERMMKTFTLL